MVDSLKVAQASKNNVVKILGLMVKMQDQQTDKTKASGSGKENSIFSELDNMADL